MIDMSELIQTQNIEQIKQEMGPVKPSQILRNTKLRQITGKLTDGHGGYCASGVLANAFGIGDDDLTRFNSSKFCEMMQGFGIYEKRISYSDIFFKNDDGWSFEQIADWFEEKGL